jgi:phospholipid transport system substrate-binding protein
MSRRASIALLILAPFIAVPLVAAGGSAEELVKQTVIQILHTVEDPTLAGRAHERARRGKIRSLVSQIFDFEEMAKRSLATHWSGRSPQERTHFVALFTDLLERTYMDRIESYNGEPIVYLGESGDAEQTEVRSKLITKGREEIPITYRLIQKNGAWKVYDLVIEGVSLVNNYRTQFNKIINQSSYSDLVRRMQEERIGVDAETGGAPAKERR